MKFKSTAVNTAKEILYNDHFVAVPYDCTSLTTLATNGVILAGTVVPANDNSAIGVLLHDVKIADNPNGTVVVHGFIDKNKMPTAPAAAAIKAMKDIVFMPFETTASSDTAASSGTTETKQ